MTTPPPGTRTEQIETLAALLSWTSGEFTRHLPDAHPDHNRWSWQGDGHGDVIRDQFRDQAALLLANGVTVTATHTTPQPGNDGQVFYGYDHNDQLYQVRNQAPVSEETVAVYATLFPTTIYFAGPPALIQQEED